ncbi:hypothetical protein HDU96_001558, partial [Phlyctochytrium bullatum]
MDPPPSSSSTTGTTNGDSMRQNHHHRPVHRMRSVSLTAAASPPPPPPPPSDANEGAPSSTTTTVIAPVPKHPPLPRTLLSSSPSSSSPSPLLALALASTTPPITTSNTTGNPSPPTKAGTPASRLSMHLDDQDLMLYRSSSSGNIAALSPPMSPVGASTTTTPPPHPALNVTTHSSVVAPPSLPSPTPSFRTGMTSNPFWGIDGSLASPPASTATSSALPVTALSKRDAATDGDHDDDTEESSARDDDGFLLVSAEQATVAAKLPTPPALGTGGLERSATVSSAVNRQQRQQLLQQAQQAQQTLPLKHPLVAAAQKPPMARSESLPIVDAKPPLVPHGVSSTLPRLSSTTQMTANTPSTAPVMLMSSMLPPYPVMAMGVPPPTMFAPMGQGEEVPSGGGVNKRISMGADKLPIPIPPGVSAASPVAIVGSLARKRSVAVAPVPVATEKEDVEFHRVFRSIPSSDRLIEDYPCALRRDTTIRGRLWVSTHHLAFSSSNPFSPLLIIPLTRVIDVQKKNVALLIPNAIEIEVAPEESTPTAPSTKVFLSSFFERDAVFDLVNRLWDLHVEPTSLRRKFPDVSGLKCSCGGVGACEACVVRREIVAQRRKDAFPFFGNGGGEAATGEDGGDNASGGKIRRRSTLKKKGFGGVKDLAPQTPSVPVPPVPPVSILRNPSGSGFASVQPVVVTSSSSSASTSSIASSSANGSPSVAQPFTPSASPLPPHPADDSATATPVPPPASANSAVGLEPLLLLPPSASSTPRSSFSAGQPATAAAAFPHTVLSPIAGSVVDSPVLGGGGGVPSPVTPGAADDAGAAVHVVAAAGNAPPQLVVVGDAGLRGASVATPPVQQQVPVVASAVSLSPKEAERQRKTREKEERRLRKEAERAEKEERKAAKKKADKSDKEGYVSSGAGGSGSGGRRKENKLKKWIEGGGAKGVAAAAAAAAAVSDARSTPSPTPAGEEEPRPVEQPVVVAKEATPAKLVTAAAAEPPAAPLSPPLSPKRERRPRKAPTTCGCRGPEKKPPSGPSLHVHHIEDKTYNVSMQHFIDLFYSLHPTAGGGNHLAKYLIERRKVTGLGIGQWTPPGTPDGAVVPSEKAMARKEGELANLEWRWDTMGAGWHRVIEYTLPLSIPLGPKQTKCIIHEEVLAAKKGKYFCVRSKTKNPDIFDGFQVISRFCLVWNGARRTRHIAETSVEFWKFTVIKAPITSGAIDGVRSNCKDLGLAFEDVRKRFGEAPLASDDEFEDDSDVPAVPQPRQKRLSRPDVGMAVPLRGDGGAPADDAEYPLHVPRRTGSKSSATASRRNSRSFLRTDDFADPAAAAAAGAVVDHAAAAPVDPVSAPAATTWAVFLSASFAPAVALCALLLMIFNSVAVWQLASAAEHLGRGMGSLGARTTELEKQVAGLKATVDVLLRGAVPMAVAPPPAAPAGGVADPEVLAKAIAAALRMAAEGEGVRAVVGRAEAERDAG